MGGGNSVVLRENQGVGGELKEKLTPLPYERGRTPSRSGVSGMTMWPFTMAKGVEQSRMSIRLWKDAGWLGNAEKNETDGWVRTEKDVPTWGKTGKRKDNRNVSRPPFCRLQGRHHLGEQKKNGKEKEKKEAKGGRARMNGVL